MLDQLFFILAQVQQLVEILLALNELGGAEPAGDPRPLGVVFNDVAHRMDAPVNGAVGAEVLHLGLDAAAGGIQQGVHQLGDTLVLGGADGNHRNTQGLRHLLDIHAAAVAPQLVHHVQGDDHGHLQAHELQGQVQVPFNIGGIHNVEDGIGLGFQDKVPGDNFFLGIGTDGVNAGQVHYLVVGALDGTGFLIHSDTGEIAHMLVGAGEGIEKCGLSTVLIACQRKNHTVSSRRVIFRASSRRMVSS